MESKDLLRILRYCAANKWDDLVFSHTSVQLNANEFLLNPKFKCFGDVGESDLVRVDINGHSLDKGKTGADFKLNGAIHSALGEKAKWVIHLHETESILTGLSKRGLRLLNQYAMMLGPINYMDYTGTVFDANVIKQVKDLVQKSNLLFLRSHGVCTWGASPGQAFLRTYFLIKACALNNRMPSDPVVPSDASIQQAVKFNFLDDVEYCNSLWQEMS